MTIHSSIVCQKLLSTNAHLGRRVAAHHFKVSICGSRNGIAILDSDKTLLFLRNAFHFIGSPIRQKGRSFFFNKKNLFLSEIMEEMASCIKDSQWRIGAFLTCSSPKQIRSRKKKRNDGSNQQPDCVVLLDADRKSSVILEADRSQIPIVSLVDSTIPLGFYQRITYPIPANAPIQFVYLFRHSITKTVILERGRIVAMKARSVFSNPRRIGLSRVVKDRTSFWIEQVRASYTAAKRPGEGRSYDAESKQGEFSMFVVLLRSRRKEIVALVFIEKKKKATQQGKAKARPFFFSGQGKGSVAGGKRSAPFCTLGRSVWY